MIRGRWVARATGWAAAGLLAAAGSASAETVTFTLPADPVAQPSQRWTVPAGVCSATFDLFGAEGSTTAGGAHVNSTLTVVPGTPYDIYVGGQGYIGIGGYNGGGGALGGGVGGGGATDVRVGPALTDRILVAGGGGGNGGAGNSGAQGMGGTGGLVGQAGTGQSVQYAGFGGGGGTATAGGGDQVGGWPYGYAGALGVGGQGGIGLAQDGTLHGNGQGGGGGGGYYGGAGGGAGFVQYLGGFPPQYLFGFPGGGGGGGSSLTAGGTVSPIPHSGNGKAIITFAPGSCPTPAPPVNPTPTNTGPASPSSPPAPGGPAPATETVVGTSTVAGTQTTTPKRAGNVRIQFTYRRRVRAPTWTSFATIDVLGVPRGATVRASCKGQGCPKTAYVVRRSGTVALRRVTGVKLSAGAVITITVRVQDKVVATFKLTVRRTGAPRVS